MVLGIMGAIPEEILGIVDLLVDKEEFIIGGRTYYRGVIDGKKVVVVYARVGKVAAAATVSALIERFGITHLIFTGVAGGIADEVNIGDVVISTDLIQHDMDASPLWGQYVIPIIDKTFIEADTHLVELATQAVTHLLTDKIHDVLPENAATEFHIKSPKCILGTIASGDLFFKNQAQKEDLLTRLPMVKCVEMEGAAVAQVCYEYSIPFVVIRTISDKANDDATINFGDFIKEVSNVYGWSIIKELIAKIQ